MASGSRRSRFVTPITVVRGEHMGSRRSRFVTPITVVPGEHMVSSRGTGSYRGKPQHFLCLDGDAQRKVKIPKQTFAKLPVDICMTTITVLAFSKNKISIVLGEWDRLKTNLVTDILGCSATWQHIPENVPYHIESWATRPCRGTSKNPEAKSFAKDPNAKLFVASIVCDDQKDKYGKMCITLPSDVGSEMELIFATGVNIAVEFIRRGGTHDTTIDFIDAYESSGCHHCDFDEEMNVVSDDDEDEEENEDEDEFKSKKEVATSLGGYSFVDARRASPSKRALDHALDMMSGSGGTVVAPDVFSPLSDPRQNPTKVKKSDDDD